MSIDTISWKEIREEVLSNPEVLEEYNGLKSEFDFARAIIEIREATGLSQREFAKKVGIKQAQLSRLESGKQLPKLDTLSNLAEAIGLETQVRFVTPSGHVSRKVNPVTIHRQSSSQEMALS